MRNRPMIRKITVLILAMAALAGTALLVTSCRKGPDPITGSTGQRKPLYRCSMHPQVTSDKPGDCPICHMKLQLVDDGGVPATPGTAQGDGMKILFYRNPMDSKVTSPVPAKDGMGMDYVPVYSDEAGGVAEANPIPGHASFSLSQDRQQLIGVTMARVAFQPLSYAVRASGRVAFDPDLYTAIEEYRQAVFSRSQMTDPGMREQSNDLIRSSRTKLKLMGISDAQIADLASKDSDPMNLLLPSGRVWVYAEIFEYELAGIKPGLQVEVEVPSLPGKVFTGRVSSISPVVDSPTRTVRVRASVPDPEGLLRPDTYVNVKIRIDLGKHLSVPEDSVLHSGDDSFVFVVKDEGRFEPRAIRTGAQTEDDYEVLSGLSEGETVVTAANFLIDSESRLRGVLRGVAPAPPVPVPGKKARK